MLLLLLQALRRLRLPLFYDQTAWVWPAGSLTHLLITMPFWTSQLWSDGGWMGTNSIPLVISSMYVMLAGGYLEWLLALMTKVGGRVRVVGGGGGVMVRSWLCKMPTGGPSCSVAHAEDRPQW
jgi:hypothetical protein